MLNNNNNNNKYRNKVSVALSFHRAATKLQIDKYM